MQEKRRTIPGIVDSSLRSLSTSYSLCSNCSSFNLSRKERKKKRLKRRRKEKFEKETVDVGVEIPYLRPSSVIFLTNSLFSSTNRNHDRLNLASWEAKWANQYEKVIMHSILLLFSPLFSPSTQLTSLCFSQRLLNNICDILQLVTLSLQLTHFSLNQQSFSESLLLLLPFLDGHICVLKSAGAEGSTSMCTGMSVSLLAKC